MTFDEKNQIIILKDTNYDDIFAIVEFMYRGEINVGQVRELELLGKNSFYKHTKNSLKILPSLIQATTFLAWRVRFTTIY